jgi:hypothetical protein
MRSTRTIRVGRWVHRLVLILAILLADQLLRFRYSKDRYIDPDDVRYVLVPPYWTYGCEVHAEKEPQLVKNLIRALNRGRSRGTSKLAFNSEMIIHRWNKPSIFISFDDMGDSGAMMFRDRTMGRRSSPTRYRSSSLRKALEAIVNSGRCEVKPTSIPCQSVNRILLYAGGSPRVLPVSTAQAGEVVKVTNDYLKTVHSYGFSFHGKDELRATFYRGESDPYVQLAGKTGAIFVLDPPLPLHTTIWSPLEFHEFKTRTVAIWQEPSEPVRGIAGFSSDASNNRFYLFYCHPDSTGDHPWDVRARQRWRTLMGAIEETAATSNVPAE